MTPSPHATVRTTAVMTRFIPDLPSQHAAPGRPVIVRGSDRAVSYDGGAGGDPASGRVAARVREPLGPGVRVTAPGERKASCEKYGLPPCVARADSVTLTRA